MIPTSTGFVRYCHLRVHQRHYQPSKTGGFVPLWSSSRLQMPGRVSAFFNLTNKIAGNINLFSEMDNVNPEVITHFASLYWISAILLTGVTLSHGGTKIVDLETRCLLPANKVGEILVRSPYMMKGYYEKCIVIPKSPFDENGFLKTGDLGFFDSDNYLFVTDRINDTFKYKTYQVSPLSIERVLLEHAAVKNAVVFNVFHERDRNHAAAIVTLKPGFESSAEEIKAFANARLSEKNKIRAKVWIREQIPYETQTGKVQRARIRKEFSKKMQEESTQS
ncbi:hypothetical protein YQE_03681, partial [Dendroctonus ponderosae]